MGKQSLAAASGTLTQAPKFEMPAVFMEPSNEIVGRFSSPYITFAHKARQDEWAKLGAKFGIIDEGEMFLIEGERLVKLAPAKLSLLHAKQFWATKNAAGDVLSTSFQEKPWPWQEAIEMVVLVYLDDGLVVANLQARTTKCTGFKILAEALKECQTPEWGNKSPAHAETLQISQPFMRFFGEISLSLPRISKKSGLPYRTTSCTIKPVTNVEVKLLKAFTESEDCNKRMADAAGRYSQQIKELESKIAK